MPLTLHLSRRQTFAFMMMPFIAPSPRTIEASRTLFDELWRNHPFSDSPGQGQRWPCSNLLNILHLHDGRFDITKDQCAVRLGTCLRRTFPTLHYSDFPRGRSLLFPQQMDLLTCADITRPEFRHSTDELHILNASAFAGSLALATQRGHRTNFPKFAWLSEPETYMRPVGEASNFRQALAGRNGIIYIEKFWNRENGRSMGSHIDLWDGDRCRTKKELHYETVTKKIDERFDNVARRIVFWEIT